METGLRGDDLAYATLDYIREHPEEWDQAHTWCGSTACFIGWAIVLALDLTTERAPSQFYGKVIETAEDLLGWTSSQVLLIYLNSTDDFTVLEQRIKNILNGTIA